MGTTATYCKDRKKFILHSPDFASAKCWAGNLAKTATHAREGKVQNNLSFFQKKNTQKTNN